jgi:uncharacterized protein
MAGAGGRMTAGAAPGLMTRRRIVVIGSGVAGLTAAYVLSRSDDVTLFEAERRLGGMPTPTRLPTPTGRTSGSTPASSSITGRPIPLLTRVFTELGVLSRTPR